MRCERTPSRLAVALLASLGLTLFTGCGGGEGKGSPQESSPSSRPMGGGMGKKRDEKQQKEDRKARDLEEQGAGKAN